VREEGEEEVGERGGRGGSGDIDEEKEEVVVVDNRKDAGCLRFALHFDAIESLQISNGLHQHRGNLSEEEGEEKRERQGGCKRGKKEE